MVYKYSGLAILQDWNQRLMGISLDLPSTYLNAIEKFTAPRERMDGKRAVAVDKPSPFLWQAPNSNAILYSGKKWVELHGFVSRILDLQSKVPSLAKFKSKKDVSKKYPAWLELALQLCRARGYWVIYPSQTTASSLAAVHEELYKAPEEYEKDVFRTLHDTGEITLGNKRLLDSLLNGGALPPFDELPLLTWDGRLNNLDDFDASAMTYAKKFRNIIGGCESLTPSDLRPRPTAGDLFCEKAD
jgi:hypothetical protein